MKILTVTTMTAIAALGLASAAAAQQSEPQKPTMAAEQHHGMMSSGSGNGKMMQMMMNHPGMQKCMTDMMAKCNRMKMMRNVSKRT